MRRPDSHRQAPKSSSRSIGICFTLFVLSNTALAYSAFPASLDLGIFLVGIVLPFGVILRDAGPQPEARTLPRWTWILVLGLGLGLRWAWVSSFQDFPLYDEMVNMVWAERVAGHGEARIFFGNLPPLYIWLLAGMFKLFGASLLSLWALPALLSTLALGFFVLAARRVLPAPAFFPAAAFLAWGFWPLFLGRFSHQAVLMVLWEAVAFWGLASYIQAGPSPRPWWRGALLGAWVGWGFTTYFGWPLVALVVALTVLWSHRHDRPGGLFGAWPFGIALAAALFPLFLDPGFRQALDYATGLSFFRQGAPSIGGGSWERTLDHFRAFLWARREPGFAYTPQWGGFLNPLLGGCFLLGLAVLGRDRSGALARWLAAAFALLFFPVLLAKSGNWFHVAALMPLFLAVAALGAARLFAGTGPRAATGGLAALLAASLALDGTNLLKTRAYLRSHSPSPEIARAYQLLDRVREERGPGFIFSDLWLKPWPPFLSPAVVPFDRLARGEEPGRDSGWAAWVMNANLKPFLQRRFPEGKAYGLSKDHPSADGGLMLWVMDATPERSSDLRRWAQAAASLRSFQEDYALVSPQDRRDFNGLLRELEQAYPAFQEDPLLGSTYWEALAYLRFLQAQGPSRGPASLKDCLDAAREATRRGYPAAHLYYELGAYEALAGNKDAAIRAFQKARRAPLDLTDAQAGLDLLKKAGDPGPRPQALQ